MARRAGPPQRLTRRDFLRLGWLSTVARGSEAVARALGQGGAAQGKPLPLGPVGVLGAHPVGSVWPGPPGSHLYVVRLPEGLLALSARCPQDGHSVAWRPRDPSEDPLAARGRFYCAADASIFDRRGLAVAGPSPRPLDSLPLHLHGESLWVDPAAPVPRTPEGLSAGLFTLEGTPPIPG